MYFHSNSRDLSQQYLRWWLICVLFLGCCTDLCFQCCRYFFHCLHFMHCHSDKKWFFKATPRICPDIIPVMVGGEICGSVWRGFGKTRPLCQTGTRKNSEVLQVTGSTVEAEWNISFSPEMKHDRLMMRSGTSPCSHLTSNIRFLKKAPAQQVLCCIVITVTHSCLLN